MHLKIRPFWVFAAGLALFAAVMFRVVWPPEAVIQAGDHNYGLMAFYKSELPGSLSQGFWRSFPLLGKVGRMPPTWNLLWLSVLPVDVYMDWIYAVNLLAASCFLYGFFRARGLGAPAAALGAVTAFWLGSNLTLVLPGHLDKYGVLVFAAGGLWALEAFLQRPGARRALLAGGAVGLMFVHQADLALFFCLPLGGYLLCGLLTRRPRGGWAWVGLMAVPALMFVFEAYRYSMATQVRGVEILERGSAEERWAFATQWSWPPEESLDLVAPGFWGWRSGVGEAPYHGRMGGSAEWPNLKNESQYLGMIPLMLALCSLVPAWGKRRWERRGEVWFWAAMGLLAFLLACGKYAPVYGWFHALPLVDTIRNPNKFLQVFQMVVGVLAAFGADAVLRGELSGRGHRFLAWGGAGVAGVLGVWALLTDPADPLQLREWAATPWAGQAAGILEGRRTALWHGAFFGGIGAGLLWAAGRARWRTGVAAALLGALALDALSLGAKYLEPMDTSFVRANPVAEFLKKDLGLHRVSVAETSGVYGLFLTHVFPANGIPFADVAVAPRLQRQYRDYFEWVDGREFLRWRDFAVKYVLMRRELWEGFRTQRGVDRLMREVYAYRLGPEQHVVVELVNPGARFGFREGEGEVLEARSTGDGFELRVRVDAERAELKLSDRWDPALYARVDEGEAVPLEKEGMLFAKVSVPRGEHRVRLGFALPALGRNLQFAGWFLTLAALLLPSRFPRTCNAPKKR